MTRELAVSNLLNFRGSLQELSSALQLFPWDSDVDLGTLEPSHLKRVFERYLADELTEAQVEAWANLVEMREDISFDNQAARLCLHELANPLLEEALTPSRANWWIDQLK